MDNYTGERPAQPLTRLSSAATGPSIQQSHRPVCCFGATCLPNIMQNTQGWYGAITSPLLEPHPLLFCLPACLLISLNLKRSAPTKPQNMKAWTIPCCIQLFVKPPGDFLMFVPLLALPPPPCQSRPCYCQCKPCLGRLPQACTLFPSLTTQCLCACACVYAWACLSQLCICFPYCSPPRSFQNHLW